MSACMYLSKLQAGEDSIQLRNKPGVVIIGNFPPLTLASCSVKWEGWEFSSFLPSTYLSLYWAISSSIYSLILTRLGPGNTEWWNPCPQHPLWVETRSQWWHEEGDMGRGLWERPPVCMQGASSEPPPRRAYEHWRGNGCRGGGQGGGGAGAE